MSGKVVSEFDSCSVLVTGATGFIGAVIVERLISSCPKIDLVYILVRTRLGKTPKERLKILLDQPLFKEKEIDYKSKISLIDGDICKDGLGLTDLDKEVLCSRVSFVFHVAANINFSSKLGTAIQTNICGTRRVLHLVKEMIKIKSFIYVSTAYSNCVQRDVIAERVYPMRYSPQEIIDLLALPADEIKKKAPEILGGHPNSYTFTKLVAENLIEEEHGVIPVAIVRPTIVLGSLNKPMAGWVDNVQNGSMAFIAGAGRGVFRTVEANPDLIADLVPCDQLAALCLAAAVRVHRNKKLEVFHFSSGDKNPITWADFCGNVIDAILKTPCLKPVLYPRAKCRANPIRNKLFVWICHYLPAVFVDLFAHMRGEPQILMGIEQKYTRGMEYSRYFTINEFHFSTKNTESLLADLGDEKSVFDFDVKNIHWQHYMETCILGVRHYYHKNPEGSIPSARSSQRVLFIIDNAFWSILTLLLCYVVSLIIDSPSTSVLIATVIVLIFRWL